MRLGPPDAESNNYLMLQFFTWDSESEGQSWWKHFEEEIPELARMGVTQVWLPPPNKANQKIGRGYDAYDLWDLGEFHQKGTVSTRWGTREELLSACALAKQHNVDILIDAVLNHKMGGDRVETFMAVPCNPQNRLKATGPVREIQGWTAFDFPGRLGKYSSFVWTQQHFTGVDWDDKTRQNEIYRIVGSGHKGWSNHVDNELGNYDYLLGLDIDFRHPAVREDLMKWGPWILEIQTVRKRSGMPKMFAVSEYWSGDIKKILPWIRAFKGETSFFDVPLHMNFNEASRKRARYDLRTIFNNTIVKIKPNDAVTFVDNHDTVEGQTLESWVDAHFKIQAYALILLRPTGHPCVFYGDLYPNKECYNEATARNLKLLIEARQRWAYGPCTDYFLEKNCIGFVRMGDARRKGCVVLGMVTASSDNFVHNLRMNVGLENARTSYRSFMTQHGKVEVDENGWESAAEAA
ncbi:hypothetical protein ONZ45_g10656 [Pleurotus djamor]|nr:hypothetical protein ONZ45_g10656 [Pleurotus djamor]